VAYDRLPWHDVLGATWDAEAEALRLEVADGPRRERRVLVLDEPGLLPETVRERVQASIVLTRHVPLVGRRGVRIVARRAAGDDELVWHVVPTPVWIPTIPTCGRPSPRPYARRARRSAGEARSGARRRARGPALRGAGRRVLLRESSGRPPAAR
jgi:hypothetical protein